MKRSPMRLTLALLFLASVSPAFHASRAAAQAPAFTKELVAFMADERSAVTKSRHGELYKPTIGKPGTWPGIVLVHGFLGITPLIRSEAETLASHGYLVLVVNLYEDSNVTNDEEGQKLWAALDHRTTLTTCEGGLSFLQNWSMDPENMGAMGWGDGGSLVLDMAAEEPTLKAAIDFGGVSQLPAQTLRRLAPRVLIEDQMVPNEALAFRFLDAHLKPHAAKSK